MVFKVFNFLLIAGVVHGFLFIMIPILMKKKVDTPIWFLNGVVLFFSLNNFQAWLIDAGYSSSIFYIKYLKVPWYMLVMPFFFAFVIYYMRIEKARKVLFKLGLLLFVLELIFRIGLIIWCDVTNADPQIIVTYTAYEEIINLLFTIYIFFKTGMILLEQELLQENILPYDDILWLKQFMLLGSLVILLWIVAIVLNAYEIVQDTKVTYYPLRLVSSVLIYWIGYQGLIRYYLTKNRVSLRKEISVAELSNNITSDKKKEGSEKQLDVYHKLEQYLKLHKRYLDESLSLSILAREMNISVSYLSKIINTYSDSNFSDYINKYRIAHAKMILSDDDYKKYTIAAIGLECGFNSKSAFYTAFKKFTSMTPTLYRQSQTKVS